MATDITMQAASASLLGLPAEIRVMIIKTVFAGLRYSHDDEDYDTVQKHGFEDLKSRIGIIEVNRLLHRESLPLLGENLTVFIRNGINKTPLLVRNHTTELDVTFHYQQFASQQSDDGKSRWKPEDYYDFLGATFPSLKHIKYVPKLDGADDCSISYVISSLRGKFDVSYRNTFLRADGLLCAAPAEGESAFNFTVNIAVEYALTFGGKDWRNLLLDIYVSHSCPSLPDDY